MPAARSRIKSRWRRSRPARSECRWARGAATAIGGKLPPDAQDRAGQRALSELDAAIEELAAARSQLAAALAASPQTEPDVSGPVPGDSSTLRTGH